MEWTKCFCLLIYQCSISLTLAVLKRQKAYRILAALPFKMSAPWLPWDSPWSLASTPWAMSLYFKFRAIYLWLLNEYYWWNQAKIYRIIRQLSHRFMCEIMIWSGDKTKLIHKKKTFPQDYDYELLNLSKTKIPITLVKEQMPSNPNQKSRTRDNKDENQHICEINSLTLHIGKVPIWFSLLWFECIGCDCKFHNFFKSYHYRKVNWINIMKLMFIMVIHTSPFSHSISGYWMKILLQT